MGIYIFDVTTLQFYLGNIIEDIQNSQTQSQNCIEGNYIKINDWFIYFMPG